VFLSYPGLSFKEAQNDQLTIVPSDRCYTNLQDYKLEIYNMAIILLSGSIILYKHYHLKSWNKTDLTSSQQVQVPQLCLQYFPSIQENTPPSPPSLPSTETGSSHSRGGLLDATTQICLPDPKEDPSIIVNTTSCIEGNVDVEEFMECLNKRHRNMILLDVDEIFSFLGRGGVFNILDDSRRVKVDKNYPVITGCTWGYNRSQVAAAVLRKKNIKVSGILAGGKNAMNPEASEHSCSDIFGERASEGSQDNFEKAFGFAKMHQVGVEELGHSLPSDVTIGQAKQFYQEYINALRPTHFITFGQCGIPVFRRLLERQGRLERFIVTYCPWDDEIAFPPGSSALISRSVESHEAFARKLERRLVIQ